MKEVLTDWLGFKSGDRAVLPFTFAIDGGHLDLVGGLRFQTNDGDLGHAC